MKRKRREEEDNRDRWVVSYADFITLLFAFFTTMYAISQVDAGKLRMFTGSMRSAFRSEAQQRVMPVIEGIVPVSPEMASVERDMRRAVDQLKERDDMDIHRDERGLVLSIGDNVFFDSGSASVRYDALPALTAIAAVLKKATNRVVIEGHTDNVPINSLRSRYASNWELSTARATEVLSLLLSEFGLPPERFSAAGYAEFRPRATNATAEGRARNRRVDVVILNRNGREGAPRG